MSGTADGRARSRADLVFERVHRPTRFWHRARGLLGRPAPEAAEAWLFARCRAVHTFGMRYPIDVVFLDGGGRVRRLVPLLAPQRVAFCLRAVHVVETRAGNIERLRLRVGQRLVFRHSEQGEAHESDTNTAAGNDRAA